jgi:hypothetical protein
MAWAPPPVEPPPPGWWTELSFNRWVAGVAAEMRDAEQTTEQAKRLRRLRRRIERIDEQIVLAQGASDARRYLHRQGIPYERSASLGERPAPPLPVEHSERRGARVLSVR